MAGSPIGTLQGDYSSMYSASPATSFTGDLERSWLSTLMGTADAERDDWLRGEQSANNAFVRDMMKLQEQNIFSAQQSQIDRDFQERMSSTAYQRAVADMKASGLNPVLAFQQGGASTPSGSAAHSSSGGSSPGQGARPRDNSTLVKFIGSLFGVIGNLIAGSLSNESYDRRTRAYQERKNK